MRKLALAIGALVVLMAASFVTPVGALAASPSHSPHVPKPHSGPGIARSPVGIPSTRVPATSTFASPVNCDSAFHFVFSPDAAGNNFLVSTASLNAGDIWAVGNSTNTSGYDQTLAEHWNGASWSVVPTQNANAFHNDLNAVAAISTNDVWAVGDYWVDGTPAGVTIFAHHWNGAIWATYAMPQPSTFSYLYGVTAIASNNVWAVGTWFDFGLGAYQTLIEHWDGTSWTQTTSANPTTFDDELFAVSAFSSTDAWAVGFQSTISSPLLSLAEHWDGATWTAITTPNLHTGSSAADNEIFGVNALEAGHAVGVGYGNHVPGPTSPMPRQGEAWDLLASGTSTSVLVSGPGTGDSELDDVARSGAGVWAVGSWQNTNSPLQTMVFPATWNGTSHALAWSPMGTSENQSAIANVLFGVTAISPYSFWAVGFDVSGASVAQTYTEAYCARNFTMTGPSTSHANFAFSVTVTVKNGNGTTATGYRGIVQFNTTDGAATVPVNYAFVAGDNGAHTFSGVVLRTAGSQTILVSDIAMPLTMPAFISVGVCVGLCQSAPGTPGSRNTNPVPARAPAARAGVTQSGAGAPGPRVPRLGVSSQGGNSAPSRAPATTTGQATNVVAAAPEAASTSAESAPSAAGAAEAVTNTSSVQAPTHRAASLLAQRQPVVNPPEQTPWNVLLFIPLIACALALIAVRWRILKEKSNGRI